MSPRLKEHVTASGLRVLVEENPEVRSAAVGFLVDTGSRDETPEIAGVSHFLEHMAFKSTRKRGAHEVLLALDNLGSKANAYTAYERTVFHAQVLPEFAVEVMNLLAEMINPALKKEDFDVEKNVIIEEIEMYNDIPEFLLFDSLMEKRYAAHPLGIRILGSKESITALTHEQMRDYHRRRYCYGNILLAVAGAVKAEEMFAAAERVELDAGTASRAASPAPGPAGHAVVRRPADQMQQFLAAWHGPRRDEVRPGFVAAILAILLGDPEGSRLFWALTHKGLVESINAGSAAFLDDGLFCAGYAAAPDKDEPVRAILMDEVHKLRDGIGVDEFERARTKFASRTVFAAESVMGRMSAVGSERLDGVPYMTPEDELKIILSLTKEEVRDFAATFDEPIVTAEIGPGR